MCILNKVKMREKSRQLGGIHEPCILNLTCTRTFINWKNFPKLKKKKSQKNQQHL